MTHRKAQLLQSQMQGLMRLTPKVATMNAAQRGRKHPGAGLRSGEDAIRTGIVHHEHHTKSAGKPRASGRTPMQTLTRKSRTGVKIGGAVVAIVIGQLPTLGKTGTAKARLILLAAHGRNGTESPIGDWGHLTLQNSICRQVWQTNSVQKVSRQLFWAVFYVGSVSALIY